MPRVGGPTPQLTQRVQEWASSQGIAEGLEDLSLSQMQQAARALDVPLVEVLDVREQAVAKAAAAVEDAGARTSADRDASGGADAGFGGTRLERSPAFGRFAFDDVGDAMGALDTGAAAGKGKARDDAKGDYGFDAKGDYGFDDKGGYDAKGAGGLEPLVPLDGDPADPIVELKPHFRLFDREKVRGLDLADVAGVPVQSAELTRFVGAENDYLHKDALTTVEMRFGKLDGGTFDRLKQAFGGLSEVPFDPQREYSVEDFLPPALQALVNQDLEPPGGVRLPGTSRLAADEMLRPLDVDKEIDLTTNCHGTAYEAARAYQGATGDVALFFGEAQSMEGITLDRCDRVADLAATEVVDIAKLDLKPGDIVQFHQGEDTSDDYATLLHTAVYVGGGLFFEKPNTEMKGEDSPYRLATGETMANPVNEFSDGDFHARVMRPKQGFEPATEAFRSMHQDTLEGWAARHDRELGVTLVDQVEMGLGGGFSGSYLSALIPVGLTTGDDGRARFE
jgi:hypothetical protein